MTVENENFFDFFGITEEQVRTLYAQSGKIIYMPQIHIPTPPKVIPESGIKSMGLKVITNKDITPLWIDVLLWLVIIVLIFTIIYVAWKLTEPEERPEIQNKDDEEKVLTHSKTILS